MKELIIELLVNVIWATSILWLPIVLSKVVKAAGKGLYKIGYTFAKVTYNIAHK